MTGMRPDNPRLSDGIRLLIPVMRRAMQDITYGGAEF